MKTTHNTFLKIITASICLLGTAMVSQGAVVVYTEDFDGQVLSHTASGDIRFNGDVGLNQWFGAVNGVAINNELQLTNFANDKTRGAGVWLNPNTWENPGQVTVAFDVLDYAAGGAGSESFFQAYYAENRGGPDQVNLDLHGAGGIDPIATGEGSAIIDTIGGQYVISANETQATISFLYTGQQNIALVFYNAATGTAMPVYSVDNLSVTVSPTPTPEPSTLGLFAMGAALLMGSRRRKSTQGALNFNEQTEFLKEGK